MGILFCEKCGKISKIEKINNQKIALCSCGFEKQLEEDSEVFSKEKIIKKLKKGKGVINSKNSLATFPNKCKKCGYEGAEVIDLGVWYSDEGGVIRYKCGKCEYVQQDKQNNT